MAIIQFILQLFAAVMLLLFAVRMVRTGVERRFGGQFAHYLTLQSSQSAAALSGAGLAVMLQSSAAVALLLCGFAATGMLTFSQGFAALLGADLGSALVIRILSYDLRWLEPLLLIAGCWLFLKTDRPNLRNMGRIILGLGLILVALQFMREAVAPLQGSPILPVLNRYIVADSLTYTAPLFFHYVYWLFDWQTFGEGAIRL